MSPGRLQTVLAVVVAVLLIGGVAAAAVVDDDDTQALRSGGDSAAATTTTAAGAGASDAAAGETTSTTTTAAAAADGGTAGGPTTPGTTPSAPSAVKEVAATADPPASRPPKPGPYRYRAVIGEDTREVTTNVEDRGAAGDVVKQLVTVETNEGSIATDFEWRNDGGYGTRSRMRFGSVTADCDWEPDLLQVRLPLRRGVEWTADTSCSTTIFGQPATLKVSARSKVVDAKRLQVTAGTFDVWVVEGTQTLTITSSSFTATQEQSGTTWYAPEIGINVRSVGTMKASGPQGAREQRAETELLSRPT